MCPHDPTHNLALNEAAPAGGPDSSRTLALNVELLLNDAGGAPEWVQLIPPGREVKGRDGREWVNDQPEGIVAAFNGDFGPIPIGFGHAIETADQHQAPPAAAWIEELEQRDGGAIWGRVAWNTWGQQAVASREYRYLSPSFLFDKTSRRVLQLMAAGLTNFPNLRMAALNQRETPPEDDKMDWSKVLEALGLPKDATPEQALNAIQTLQGERETALNQAKAPPLGEFVPRADYDLAVNARQTAEALLAEREKADLASSIESEISAALVAKKIAPATAEYYRAMCAQEGGLEQFKEFIKAAPVLAPDQVIQGEPGKPGAGTLTADELAVCQRMGLNEKEYLAAKA